MSLDRATFQAFQALALAEAGIRLGETKRHLVEARLARRLRELGLASPKDYLARLEGDGGAEERVRFLDAIATNFTRFFREADHFAVLRARVAEARAAGQARFRFWCAGCATGEEPYTLAMALAGPLEGCDWKILATDLSTRALAAAARATYPAEAAAAVPAAERARFLAPGDEPGTVVVAPALRERVVLRRHNLARPPFPLRGPLDAVLCRNVMIYLDHAVRAALVREVERLLAPRGLFLVGHAETLNGLGSALRLLQPSVFARRPAGDRRAA